MKSVLLFLFSLVTIAQAQTLDRILVVVNSEIVLESDLRKFQTQLKTGQAFDDTVGMSLEEVRQNQKKQLEYLILQKIIDSEIKRLNLSVTSDRVDQEIRDLARKNKISINELYQAIKAQGMGISEYQAFMKNQIERRSLFDSEILSKLKVSEEEVRSEYNKTHSHVPTSINEYSLAHIFFNPKKGGEAQAQKRAQNALEKLKEGLSFENAAEQFSEDPNFSNGGFLGTFKTGESIKELESVSSSLNVGETSGVVKTKIGYHIIKLLDRKSLSDPQFDRAKEQVRAQVLERHAQRQMKIWLQNKKDESFIRYNQPQ